MDDTTDKPSSPDGPTDVGAAPGATDGAYTGMDILDPSEPDSPGPGGRLPEPAVAGRAEGESDAGGSKGPDQAESAAGPGVPGGGSRPAGEDEPAPRPWLGEERELLAEIARKVRATRATRYEHEGVLLELNHAELAALGDFAAKDRFPEAGWRRGVLEVLALEISLAAEARSGAPGDGGLRTIYLDSIERARTAIEASLIAEGPSSRIGEGLARSGERLKKVEVRLDEILPPREQAFVETARGRLREEIERGLRFLDAGTPADAAACFRRASEADPSDLDAVAYLAWATYLASPSRKEAAPACLAELRRLSAGREGFGLGRLLMARIHKAEGDLDEAAREIGAALDIDRDLDEAREEWAGLPPEVRRRPSKRAQATERPLVPERPVSGRRLLASVALVIVVAGSFGYAGFVLYSIGAGGKEIGLGADDFWDVIPLEDIRVGETSIEARLVEAEALDPVERGRRLDEMCRRLAARGFARATFRGPVGEATVAGCVAGRASLAPPAG